jgi:dienelactone hydrolase
VADSFAARGYLVIAPDMFDGEPVPHGDGDLLGFSMKEWLGRHQSWRVVGVIERVLRAVRADISN